MALIDFIRSLTQTEWELTYAITAVGDPIKLWEEANWKRKAGRQREADKLIRALWSYLQSATGGDREGTEEFVVLRERVQRYRENRR